MSQITQVSQSCQKHKKLPSILIVKEARYICEDCAIFEPRYKQEHMVEKEAVSNEIEQISKQCNELLQQQKSIQSSIDQKSTSLLRTIEHYQVSVINKINNQFMQVKTKVSEVFMQNVSEIGESKKGKAKARLDLLMREKVCEQIIKNHFESSKELSYLRQAMEREIEKVNELYKMMKQQIEQNITVKVDVLKAFQPLLEFKFNQATEKKVQNQQIDDNLLDFSDFLIPIQEEKLEELISFSLEDSLVQMKRKSVERMKTAACLEDSICSEFSITKSFESQVFNLAISEIAPNNENQSLLSDRSFSCSSTVSKSQPSAQASNKKSAIEITCSNQLHTKLLSIPPTIKSIKISNLAITCQEFSQLMKEKISRSFINTLEIVNCPKLSDKVLLEIKTHKCKSLKKLEIKDCKQFNWNNKKVKEVVKKLESEGVKIVY